MREDKIVKCRVIEQVVAYKDIPAIFISFLLNMGYFVNKRVKL